MKMVVGFSLILLVLWLVTMYQSDESIQTQTYSAEEQAKLDTLRRMLGREEIEMKEGGEEGFFSKALVVFIILSGGIIIIWYLFKDKTAEANASFVTVIVEQEIGAGQWLKVVKYQHEYWVLGVTLQTVTLLKTLSEEEWSYEAINKTNNKSGMNLNKGFAAILESFKKQ